MIKNIIIIALFGALGTLARYSIVTYVPAHFPTVFPWGTLFCNVFGSFLLGCIFGMVERIPRFKTWQDALGTGFLGAFTTFSAYTLEIVTMIERGAIFTAMLYMFISVGIGYIVAWLGYRSCAPAASKVGELK